MSPSMETRIRPNDEDIEKVVVSLLEGQKNQNLGQERRAAQSETPDEEESNKISEEQDASLAWKLTGESYLEGPDQILPSTAVYTCEAEGATKISTVEDPSGIKMRTPISVPSLLKLTAQEAPDRTALAVKRNDVWQTLSYSQYYQTVRTIAKGFIALGLERFHSVCILGFNSPEWVQADLAAIFAGGFAAGIYTTNSAEACAFCAIDSKANIFVVEDEKQLAKILQIRSQLPHLKAIVQYTGEPPANEEGVLSWNKLLLLGQTQSDTLLDSRLSKIAVNQCCTIIYTSGTTGNPKGVMLSHDNLTWCAHAIGTVSNFRYCEDEVISFLPLSHVAAQIMDVYAPMTGGATTYFADKDALKGSLMTTMREVRPTKFLAVPRVWEKIYEKMMDIGRETTGVKRMLAQWAKSKALEYNMKRMNGVSHEDAASWGFRLADKLILSKIRQALGLTRCNLHLSGAAPINADILKYFYSLNIVVTEVYGMSECTGPHCVAVESGFRLASCGRTMPGCATLIGQPDAEGNGEILLAGRHVSMGYLQQKEKTMAAIDQDGWLHSEDVGHLDRDGYLFITGRIKELLITAGGENVAPVPIEDRVKSELPIMSQAVLLGDRLKFLSLLLTLKTEVDRESQEPLDTLLPYTKMWIEQHGNCQVDTVQDVLDQLYTKNNQKLKQAIQKGLDNVNGRAPSNAQKIQKWHLLPTDFSINGGELGPTLKLKRQLVYNKYKNVIENIYS